MLAHAGILGIDVARDLLVVNQDLEKGFLCGEKILDPPPAHRGLFFLYEQHYIDKLGAHTGGAAHVARSRNDINATVTRMRLRVRILEFLDEGLRSVAAALDLAGGQLHTVMSAFTHLQPAQPTTLAHYLAGMASELLRSLAAVAAALHGVDRCPMGAVTGSGTSFPIDRSLVAGLLGFQEVADNSLDAVASRDYLAAVLAGLASFGVTLTRWATDFQLWASHAYGFLDWPDALVSTSSTMPQKRNAYVWEDIRGQAIHPAGALMNVLMGMKNTPFSNGVEVSAEATAHVWPALDAIEKATRLTRLLVENIEVNPARMRRFLDGADVTMTALADGLVAQHGLAFRTAHTAVGRLARVLPAGDELSSAGARRLLEEILRDLTGQPLALSDGLLEALDAEKSLLAARHGGGPAPSSVAAQLARLAGEKQRLEDEVRAWRERLDKADERLRAAVRELVQA